VRVQVCNVGGEQTGVRPLHQPAVDVLGIALQDAEQSGSDLSEDEEELLRLLVLGRTLLKRGQSADPAAGAQCISYTEHRVLANDELVIQLQALNEQEGQAALKHLAALMVAGEQVT